MKKIIICISMMLALGFTVNAQEVRREGNNFTRVINQKTPAVETKTEFTFTDSKGNVCPIYLSGSGKAFIKKVSKAGKEYKQYIPEVGRQINPKAYEEKKNK